MKRVQIQSFFWSVFYGVNLRIQSDYRKIRTRNSSVFENFSRSVTKSKSLILSSKKTFFSDFINSELKQSPMTVFRWLRYIKKGVLKNFAKFTGKHLCQSLFFNKVDATLLKQNSGTGDFAWILRNFQDYFFHSTPLDDCLCQRRNVTLSETAHWKCSI